MSKRLPATPLISRRTFVCGASAATLTLAACNAVPPVAPSGRTLAARAASIELAAIEKAAGGRLGVAALNLRTGGKLHYRHDERFAMCSTFKWVLVALVLQRVDRDEESLSRTIVFAPTDLVTYSPVTEKHADGQGMTVAQLCEATLTTSDNTAANLLLATLGGPPGFTQGVRGWGDRTTRLDRLEPMLNENKKGDPQDTTTPRAMIELMEQVLFGEVLKPESTVRLREWMVATRTGSGRLRAGFGDDWLVGNRTGTSEHDQSNDLAFAVSKSMAMLTPGPLLVVSYANAPEPMSKGTDSVHQQVAREVVRVLT